MRRVSGMIVLAIVLIIAVFAILFLLNDDAREEINEAGENLEDAGENVGDAAENVGDAVEIVSEDVEETTEELGIDEAVDEAAEDVEQAAEELEPVAEEVEQEAEEVAQDVAEEAGDEIEEAGDEIEERTDEIEEETDYDPEGALDDDNTLYDLLRSRADMADFVVLVQHAGLVELLEEESDYTVFVPSRVALQAIPDDVRNDAEALRTLLERHIVEDDHTAEELQDIDSLDTLSGDTLTISGEGDRLRINSAILIKETDLEAENGVVHVIDRVIGLGR